MKSGEMDFNRTNSLVSAVTENGSGSSFEDLNVNSREFAGAVVGRRIIVEMHEGYFGLPWYSNISPE
jgi:hypothetical protein